jgi:hypothetical protein
MRTCPPETMAHYPGAATRKACELYEPITKQVGYAYPTSSAACRFGFGRSGCYYVHFQRGPQRHSFRRDRGFATLAEAFQYADQQPEEYDYFSLRPDGSTPWMPSDKTRTDPPMSEHGSATYLPATHPARLALA